MPNVPSPSPPPLRGTRCPLFDRAPGRIICIMFPAEVNDPGIRSRVLSPTPSPLMVRHRHVHRCSLNYRLWMDLSRWDRCEKKKKKRGKKRSSESHKFFSTRLIFLPANRGRKRISKFYFHFPEVSEEIFSLWDEININE